MIAKIEEAMQLLGRLPAWTFVLWLAWIVLGLALFYVTATVVKSRETGSADSSDTPKISGFILKVWQREQSNFVESNGIPAREREIKVWYQFFERGMIAYNSIDSYSWVIHYPDRSYSKSENPEILISQHHVDQVNWNRFEEFATANSGVQERRSAYARLITDRKIIGGIGTIYIRDDLMPRLGEPIFAPNSPRGVFTEKMTHDVLLLEGDRYSLLVGLPNRPSDLPGNLQVRAVFAFFSNSTYRKFVVDVGDEDVPWANK